MKTKFLTPLLSILIFSAVGVALVSAQGSGGSLGGSGGGNPPPVGVRVTLENPFNCGGVTPCTLFTLLEAIIDGILLPIGGVLAVLAFIYSGFLYVTAQGSETKLATAHKALLYTSIGTAVLLGSWVIAEVIENTINQLR